MQQRTTTMTSHQIEWSEVTRTRSPGGLYWEISARTRHPHGDTLPVVSIHVTTRREWTSEEIDQVRSEVVASIEALTTAMGDTSGYAGSDDD
jgi:hypothetical protein